MIDMSKINNVLHWIDERREAMEQNRLAQSRNSPVRVIKQRRGFLGSLFKFMLVVYVVGTLALLVFVVGAAPTGADGHLSDGGALGILFVLMFGAFTLGFPWLVGFVILLVLVLLTRGKTIYVYEAAPQPHLPPPQAAPSKTGPWG